VERGDADASWAFESLALFSPDAHERRPELMEWFRGLYASGADSTPREAVVRLVDANLGHDTLDRLHLIRAPSLVVAGEQDTTFMSRQVAERIPGARLELLTGEGSSHLLHLERREQFLQVALAFVLRQ
jgi:3-oxoadipate enol-lactonase